MAWTAEPRLGMRDQGLGFRVEGPIGVVIHIVE